MFRKLKLLIFALSLLGSSVHAQTLRDAQKLKQQAKLKQKQLAIPGPAIRRFLMMSPTERQNALDQLPPARRVPLENRVKRLEQMQPADRERTLRRIEIFDALPPQRRLVVRAAIERLRTMPVRARRMYVESEDAKLRFDPEELELLRDVSGFPLTDESR